MAIPLTISTWIPNWKWISRRNKPSPWKHKLSWCTVSSAQKLNYWFSSSRKCAGKSDSIWYCYLLLPKLHNLSYCVEGRNKCLLQNFNNYGIYLSEVAKLQKRSTEIQLETIMWVVRSVHLFSFNTFPKGKSFKSSSLLFHSMGNHRRDLYAFRVFYGCRWGWTRSSYQTELFSIKTNELVNPLFLTLTLSS